MRDRTYLLCTSWSKKSKVSKVIKNEVFIRTENFIYFADESWCNRDKNICPNDNI